MTYVAFEMNVLARIEFDSVAIPFAARSELGLALKRRGKRVTANHMLQAAWTCNVAAIQNNSERLSEQDVETIITDAYVPGHQLSNPALRYWFSETDAWWFDNVRRNLDRLGSPNLFAIGASIAMDVGDYAMSFDERTRELRQPLSNIFKRLWKLFPEPVNNSQNNTCQNKPVNEFLAESFTEMLFLTLPDNAPAARRDRWREQWLRGPGELWPDIEGANAGKLGSRSSSKTQFLKSLEETLSIASNIKHWAISFREPGFVSAQEITETIGRIRRVDAVYTKDVSELTGHKAVVITA